MHELSIAQAIVDVARRHAAGRRVVRVEVKVGHLRQVVPDSLHFAFALVAQDTALDGAELAIAQIPAAGRCRDCGAESVLDGFPLCCARCGGLDMEVLAGEELLVDALELDEQAAIEKETVIEEQAAIVEQAMANVSVPGAMAPPHEELVTNERMGHGSHI
jgi:hydrogenase nickel incorporation protein HypA/HybF